ncbi:MULTISPECIES: PIN domain-containing protein [unclassified Nodularia (in: cyanobacteria)]|uniref:PIN domain-containing protein n=1 Tax=unclassified Nodularia (in: cyanobacteria) TaxID=2656917 RepID=UPI001880AE04|nr:MULTISPECIES: PIN domain-containing protein [unclassified Nodularia (in: cyanobacteria)]MBE9198448.1 PIN domain-containing protein [Nodularia sp. LEGE 06071]MCC2691087.1 PIN domain-containing protein [Nodularia sp. LEGE 04288]
MPVNYTVQADVIDITTDSPQKGDIFLVDTNVWYWLTYPPASLSAQQHQINSYPNYIADTLTVGATLCYSGLSLAELAHRIESEEYKLSAYGLTTGPDYRRRAKEYRHNHASERARVVSQVQTAWSQVQSISAQIDLKLDETTVDAAITRFITQPLDGYDLFILESMKQERLTKIITDDGDYVTVPGIQMFTANPQVIRAARSMNKLITR